MPQRVGQRMAQQWGWLSAGHSVHVSRQVAGVGKLLGGWLRQTQQAQNRSADDV